MQLIRLAAILTVALALPLVGCGEDDGGTGTSETSAELRVLVGGGDYRPEAEWCPTLRTCLKDIRWDEYTAERAVGIGIGPAPGCDPRVAAAAKLCEESTPVGIELSEPDVACGAVYFAQLRMYDNDFELRRDLGCDGYQMTTSAPPTPTTTSPGASSSGGDCGDGGVNSYNVKAEGVDCETALQVVAEWEQMICESPGTCAVAGFLCNAVKRGVEATDVSCSRGTEHVSWEAGA